MLVGKALYHYPLVFSLQPHWSLWDSSRGVSEVFFREGVTSVTGYDPQGNLANVKESAPIIGNHLFLQSFAQTKKLII